MMSGGRAQLGGEGFPGRERTQLREREGEPRAQESLLANGRTLCCCLDQLLAEDLQELAVYSLAGYFRLRAAR